MTYRDLLIERPAPDVARVVLNRPEKLNALSHNLRREIIAAMGALGADPAIRAIILTGAGDRAFAAGQDLGEARDFEAAKIGDVIAEWMELYRAVGQCEKPVVAAINGYAVGAAFQLALLCDLRVAAESARLAMLEVEDGIPCITGTRLLYEYVGRGRAAELVLTTRFCEAREALGWGLLNRVVAPEALAGIALELAQTLARKPPGAVMATRRWLWQLLMRDWPMTEDFVRQAQTQAYVTGEAQQAMADFLAKRARDRSK